MELRQSTSQVIRFGPFVDSTDGVTPETGLTIAQADMQLSKDGGAFAQKNTTGNATHDVDGYYSTTLDTTDTGTAGILKLQVTVSGALLVWENFEVVTQTYYDAKHTGTFNNLGGTAQTADHTAAIADIPTVSEFNARTLVSADYFNSTTDDVIVGTNNDKTGYSATATNMRGTDNALLAASYTAPDNTTILDTNTKVTALNDITAADVWSVATRELTSGNNIALAKGVGLTGLNDIAAIDVLAAGDIDGFSLEESQKLILSASAGVLSGAATTTVTIQAADGSKARLTATVDADGNRSAVIKDATG